MHGWSDSETSSCAEDYKTTRWPVPDANCRQRADGNTVWWVTEITAHVDAREDTGRSREKHAKHREERLARRVVSVRVVGQNVGAVPDETIVYIEN